VASASRGEPVYVPAFAGTHCASPWRDGQAELAWVDKTDKTVFWRELELYTNFN